MGGGFTRAKNEAALKNNGAKDLILRPDEEFSSLMSERGLNVEPWGMV